MRNALALALLASTAALATLATGCDFPGGCGGYTGGNDRVLVRGNDTLILCENGGFVGDLATGNLEGRYDLDAQNTSITRGTLTDTRVTAFTLSENDGGEAFAPELGAGAWTDAVLDQVAIDHANVQCTNLEGRTWWTEQAPDGDATSLSTSSQARVSAR